MDIHFQDPKIWDHPKIVIEVDDCYVADRIVEMLRSEAKEAVNADMWDAALKYIKASIELDKASDELCNWKIKQEDEA